MFRKKYRPSNQKKRSKKPLVFFLLFCLTSLLFFRDRVACHLLDMYVGHFLPKDIKSQLVIEKREKKDGHLYLSGFTFNTSGEKITAECIDIYSSIHLFPFKVTSFVEVQNPEIKLSYEPKAHPGSSLLGLLFPSKHFELKLNVEKGCLSLPEPAVEPLYFSYLNDGSKESIGHFLLSQDVSQEKPLCNVVLSQQGDLVRAQLEVESKDLSVLAPLISAFGKDQNSYLSYLQGELKIQVDLLLSESHELQKLSGEIDLQNVIAKSKDELLSCKIDVCKGNFSYPPFALEAVAGKEEKNLPFWKKAEGYLTFTGAHFFSKKQKSVGVKDVVGELVLIPSQDPLLKLTAALTAEDKEIPLTLNSSGILHEDGSFWLQSDLVFSNAIESKSQIIFSLCSVKEESYVLQTDLLNVDAELLSFAHLAGLLPEDIRLQARNLEGSLTASIDHGQLQRLQWKRFKMTDAVANAPYVHLAMEDLLSDGLLVKEEGKWQLEEIDMDLQKSTLKKDQLYLSDINLSVHFHEGVMQPSALAARWDQGSLSLSAYGPLDELSSKVEIDSSWNTLLAQLYPSLILPIDIQSYTKIDLAFKDNKALLQGQTQCISQNEKIAPILFSLVVPAQGKGAIWQKKLSFADAKGTLQSESLPQAMYSSLVSLVDRELAISGNVGIDMTLSHGKIKTFIKSPDLFIEKKSMALSTGEIGIKKPAFFTYDFFLHSQSAEFDLFDSFFADTSGVTLGAINGHFTLQDNRLKADRIVATCEGVTLPFSLFFDAEGLFIETASVEGLVEDICKVELVKKYLGSSASKIHGVFFLPSGGCNVLVQKTDGDWIWHWKLSASFKDLSMALAPNMLLQGGECDVSYDSSTMLSSMKKTKGKLNLWQGSYVFALNDFLFDPRKENDFTLRVQEGKNSLMNLSGVVKLTQDVEIIFDKDKTNILSIPLHVNSLKMGRDLVIKEMDAEILLSEEDRKACLMETKHMQALSYDTLASMEENLLSLHGDVTAHMSFTQLDKWKVKLVGPKLSWKGKDLSYCELLGTYKNSLLTFEKISWDKSYLQTAIGFELEGFKIPYLKFSSPEARVELQGSYSYASKVLEASRVNFSIASLLMGKQLSKYCKGVFNGSAAGSCLFDSSLRLLSAKTEASLFSKLEFPFSCDLKSKEKISINYDAAKGFQISKLDLTAFVCESAEMLGRLCMDSLTYMPESETAFLSKCQLVLAPSGTISLASSGLLPADVCHMKKDLDWQLAGDVKISKTGMEAGFALKPGIYSAGGKDYTLLEPRLQLTATSLHLRSRMDLGIPIWCDVQKEFSKDSPLYVLLRANSEAEGLKILCKEKNGRFDPQRIEGKLMGLEANLQKSTHISDGAFFGFVKLDCVKAGPLLSKQMKEIVNSLKLGAGYTLQGHFFLPETDKEDFSFHGDIKAEKCQFLGYTFQALQVKANISPSKVLLEEIKIEDPAGQLVVKLCAIDKDPFTNKWTLSMPLGHIREFRPSLLVADGKKSAEKPFLLKNLSVYDFEGTLGDSKSFTGSGALHFLNSSKKEFSLLDIPLEMIKDLGLDTGMLTPISGEADFIIRKGRCMFSELKNSYSEGRRSQFFLSDDTPAYIDFEGNWHVDLKMKQQVLLKWSESLLVSIRGKIDKPKYSLKNVEDSI